MHGARRAGRPAESAHSGARGALSCAVPSFHPRRAAAAVGLLQCLVAGCRGEGPPPRAARAAPTQASAAHATDVPPVTDSGPVLQDGHAVIRPEAVGPLHVGAWRRVAMSFVYAMTAFSGPDDTEITPVRGVGKDTVTVILVNDTVAQLQVMRPGARTVDGIQVGTPLATVRARPGAVPGRDGPATTIHLPRYCGITFSTADSSAHSGVPQGKGALPFPPDSTVIRTIIVGKCAGT